LRRQRRHSYQPRATPWVYRPKTILSAESAIHCSSQPPREQRNGRLEIRLQTSGRKESGWGRGRLRPRFLAVGGMRTRDEAVPAHCLRVRLSGRGHNQCSASTATRLWNKAQGWTKGTTLGSGNGGPLTPTGLWPADDAGDCLFLPPRRRPVGIAAKANWRPGSRAILPSRPPHRACAGRRVPRSRQSPLA